MTKTKKTKTPFVFDPNKPLLYKIEKIPQGFTIFREGFINSKVIIDKELNLTLLKSKDDGSYEEYGPVINFLDYARLKEIVVNSIVEKWITNRTDKLAAQGKPEHSCRTNKKLKEWAKKNFAKGLNFLLYPAWKSIVESVDPSILAVYKKFFVVRGPKAYIPRIFSNLEIYKNKTLINDILNYNSIHIFLQDACIEDGKVFFQRRGIWDRIEERTENWRLLFSDTSKTYKALNLTLDRWPRGVPVGLATRLHTIHLTEPIYDRVKMIAVLCSLVESEYDRKINRVSCIMRSSPEQIRKAFKIFKKNYEKNHKVKFPFTLRGMKGISHLISYVSDFDSPHDGEIVGLLEKSHRWHQDMQIRLAAEAERRRIEWELGAPERERLAALNRDEWERRQAEEAAQIELEKKMSTVLPPIPLPENESFRFLKTFEEVVKEGEEMGHCIATYASSAVRGQCFLFHIDHDDEKASIMVNKEGRIVQCYGPRNCINKASEWAKRELSGWANKLAQEYNKSIKTPENETGFISAADAIRRNHALPNFEIAQEYRAVPVLVDDVAF